MATISRICAACVVASLAAWTGGCYSPTDNMPAQPAGSGQAAPADGSSHSVDPEMQKEVEAMLAKLSPEDRALAEKQNVCPISDEPLGSMGVPPKLELNGKTVFLCCEGCEDAIRQDPDKYLAKLKSE